MISNITTMILAIKSIAIAIESAIRVLAKTVLSLRWERVRGNIHLGRCASGLASRPSSTVLHVRNSRVLTKKDCPAFGVLLKSCSISGGLHSSWFGPGRYYLVGRGVL